MFFKNKSLVNSVINSTELLKFEESNKISLVGQQPRKFSTT